MIGTDSPAVSSPLLRCFVQYAPYPYPFLVADIVGVADICWRCAVGCCAFRSAQDLISEQ